MTLPPALRRWWPQFKRLHRRLTLLSGGVFRALAPVLGRRGVARTATGRSIDTAAYEPDAVTIHPGGPQAVVVRTPTRGEPAGHPVFAAERTAVIPAGFTLEVRGGRLVGQSGASVTPAGVLDHETSPYFGVFDWREHPMYLRPTVGRVEHVPGTVLSLAARGAAGNYYHFLYDAIGRLAVFEDSMPGEPGDAMEAVDAIVVPHRTRYQQQLLELAGLGDRLARRLIEPRDGYTVAADRLLVPSNPNWALQAPPETVAWLRRRLPPHSPPDRAQRLYLTRGSAPQTRRYVEEGQLLPELERRGFVRLDAGSLSVQEQIDVFSRAEAIVAPHGAALTNVTFAPPGVKVLELFPASYVHRGLWAICQAIEADYRYLVSDLPAHPHPANAGVSDDVSIPVRRVLAVLDELLD